MRSCFPTIFIPFLSTFSAQASNNKPAVNIDTIPSTASPNASLAQFLSTPNSLDAPHVHAINSTTYDWWYFYALSPSLDTSVVIIFFSATNTAFPFLGDIPSDVSVALTVTLPNGTVFATGLPASKAVVYSGGNLGDAATGTWSGTGFSFTGTPDLSEYVVTIDVEAELGVKGTMVLKSVCSFFTLTICHNATLILLVRYSKHHRITPAPRAHKHPIQVLPHIGSSNAIPDAVATVSLSIDGTPGGVHFNNGVGYHDKNWGDIPFPLALQSWYWGHMHLGPYSIVYFDGISALDHKEYVSIYVSLRGKIICSSCAPGSVVVRPVNRTYPPTVGNGDPLGLSVRVPDFQGQGSVSLVFNVSFERVGAEVEGAYTRWLGRVEGGVVVTDTLGKRGKSWKSERYEGVGMGMFEEFRLS